MLCYPKLPALMVPICCLGILDCQSIDFQGPDTSRRWFNPSTFDQEDKAGETLHDVSFEITFAASDGGELTVKDCYEVFALGETAIAQREHARREWLKAS